MHLIINVFCDILTRFVFLPYFIICFSGIFWDSPLPRTIFPVRWDNRSQRILLKLIFLGLFWIVAGSSSQAYRPGSGVMSNFNNNKKSKYLVDNKWCARQISRVKSWERKSKVYEFVFAFSYIILECPFINHIISQHIWMISKEWWAWNNNIFPQP